MPINKCFVDKMTNKNRYLSLNLLKIALHYVFTPEEVDQIKPLLITNI